MEFYFTNFNTSNDTKEHGQKCQGSLWIHRGSQEELDQDRGAQLCFKRHRFV